ncbi:MAG: hypothetical protein MHM6MM_008106 [Cercozoa sp. M6MM]
MALFLNTHSQLSDGEFVDYFDSLGRRDQPHDPLDSERLRVLLDIGSHFKFGEIFRIVTGSGVYFWRKTEQFYRRTRPSVRSILRRFCSNGFLNALIDFMHKVKADHYGPSVREQLPEAVPQVLMYFARHGLGFGNTGTADLEEKRFLCLQLLYDTVRPPAPLDDIMPHINLDVLHLIREF